MAQRTRLAWVASLTLVESALLQELRKPPEQRSWHGRIAGLIPYDLRPPRVERITRAWWNPEDERVFTSQAFGIGWSVNLGRLAGLLGWRGAE